MAPANEFDCALATRLYNRDDKSIQPSINFPVTKDRRFLAAWYKEYSWLEYSISKDAAFCFACRKFGIEHGYSDKAFVQNGFSNWKKGPDTFKKHQSSHVHVACCIALKNRIACDQQHQSVATQISGNHSKEVKSNRYHLGIIIESIIWLAKQGLAFRGHKVSEQR